MSFLFGILYLIGMGLVVFFLGRIFPRKWLFPTRFPFKSFAFEKNGAIYDKLQIRKWKTKLPDASVMLHGIVPWLIPKKRIEDTAKIPILIKETCIAEATHTVVALLGFWCVRIVKGAGGWILSVLFFLYNLPYILMQRYNRPRLLRTQQMLERRAQPCGC